MLQVTLRYLCPRRNAPEEEVNLIDRRAERVLLGGLWHEPDALFARLSAIGFTPDLLAVPEHRFLWDESHELWVRFEPVTLAAMWKALKRLEVKNGRISRTADEMGGNPAEWLIDTYVAAYHWWPYSPGDMGERGRWTEPEDDEQSFYFTWACAAARKLMWLGASRHLKFRAERALKAAETGDDPDLLNQEL